MRANTLIEPKEAPFMANVAFSEFELIRVLYARWAWGLESGSSLPPLDPAPRSAASPLPFEHASAAQWSEQWQATLLGVVEAWKAAQDGIPTTGAYATGGLSGFSEVVSSADFAAWARTVSRQRLAPGSQPGASASDVMNAVGVGFRLWIVIPVHGLYVERIERSTLLASYETYFSSEAARKALVDFRESA